MASGSIATAVIAWTSSTRRPKRHWLLFRMVGGAMLVGHSTRSLLDALVFSGFTLPIDRVMVRGEWKLIDGRHEDAVQAGEAYAAIARELYSDEMSA